MASPDTAAPAPTSASALASASASALEQADPSALTADLLHQLLRHLEEHPLPPLTPKPPTTPPPPHLLQPAVWETGGGREDESRQHMSLLRSLQQTGKLKGGERLAEYYVDAVHFT